MIDNGKIYISAHLRSVCQRLGISIQPARPFQPTDKAVVERIFRTIGEDLLAALPGYKGPDVYGRGEHPELEAYYFVDELELIIREWIAERYHRRAHQGLVVPEVPGLDLSPERRFRARDRACGPGAGPNESGSGLRLPAGRVAHDPELRG